MHVDVISNYLPSKQNQNTTRQTGMFRVCCCCCRRQLTLLQTEINYGLRDTNASAGAEFAYFDMRDGRNTINADGGIRDGKDEKSTISDVELQP